MINNETAAMLNRRGKEKALARAKVAAEYPDAPAETAKRWVVVKSVTATLVGVGALKFPAGRVIEDPIVKGILERQGAELRPIA